MMKLNLSPGDRKIVFLGGPVFLLVIFWAYPAYILAPRFKSLSSLGQQVRATREQLRGLEASVVNEAMIREQYDQVNETVASLRHLLPPEEELPAVIEYLSSLASKSSVKIQTIFPQRSTDDREASQKGQGPSGMVVYKDVPIQIEALAGYHQLGAFLSLVESGDKPIQVSSLRISADRREPKRHIIKLLLRSYFAVQDATPPRKASIRNRDNHA
jgi:Tfp pilus assembly protein PilO